MLNELKMLADSIRSAGFSGEEWNDKFKEIKVKGAPCFVISLSKTGDINSIRFLEPDRAKHLRTWLGGSNGECFPSFNFTPFYELIEEKNHPLSAAEKTAAIKSFAQLFLSSTELPADFGPIKFVDRTKPDKKTAKCLGSIATSFFTKTTFGVPENDPIFSLKTALQALLSAGSAETFNDKLLDFLRRNMSLEMALQKEPPTIWSLLFRRSPDVVLFFDIDEPGEYSIASERAMKVINERLLERSSAATVYSETFEFDAFGCPVSQAEMEEKLPEVKLPGALSNTKLRSMNSESQCQMRYGRINAESYPVGKTIRAAAKSAISWISSPEREGKTWAIAGANELVFAYPKVMPPEPLALAQLMGNGKISADQEKVKEARFERYAMDALQGLKTLSNDKPNAEIEVFAIKKADKARRKVVFYRNYSLDKLEEAVFAWLAGADNVPPVLFRKWPSMEKGEKAAKGKNPVPFDWHAPLPLAVIPLIYEVWSQDRNEKFEPKFRSAPLYDGVPVFDGLELFIGDSITTGLAQRMLSLLLQNSSGLCKLTGNLAHKHDVISNVRAVRHLETTLPLFGILLYKLNRTKEIYMENAPYLIGRFLNLSDGLHAVWCRNVKGKDPLPTQLLGSSLYASFQLNPIQAFANAGLRLKPYLDWAKTNQTKDVALARWYVGEFGRVTAAISEMGIPSRLSDVDKAEMLLGYLASHGKQPEAENTES